MNGLPAPGHTARISGATLALSREVVHDPPTSPLVMAVGLSSQPRMAGHHPDIDIRWNKITLALSSHADGGLTDRDFQLAARIQELDQPTQPA